MFSQTAEYALRAVTWLAANQDSGPMGVPKIAEATLVPSSYLAKILQSLVKSEIAISKRGIGGGFVLACPPDQLSVLDVVNAVDAIKRIRTCPLKLSTHKSKLCPMHARLDEAMETVEKALAESMISDLLYDQNRPKPLVDTICW